MKITKWILLSITSFLLLGFSYQYITSKNEFEGQIEYLIDVKSKTENISTEKLKFFFGTKMIMHIKDGNYKMSYNGKELIAIYYLNKANKQYTNRYGIDSLEVYNMNIENRKLINSNFQNTNEKILNRKCELLVNELDQAKNYYWFDKKLYINPSKFENHKFSFINLYFEKAKSPWLKHKYEGTNIEITYTATKITSKKIDVKIFNLPNLPELNLSF